jgi:hypothetical protein
MTDDIVETTPAQKEETVQTPAPKEETKTEELFPKAEVTKMMKAQAAEFTKKLKALEEKASKLDEIEKAKLSDEEKAKAKLADLEAKIAEKEKALQDKALKDLYREKIEQAIADGRMKLPKGKTIASLVARSKAIEEGEIDADVEDLIGFFPPDEPTKAIGGGSQQPPAKSPDIKDQIAALTVQAADAKLSAQERHRIQSEIVSLKLKADGIIG